MANVRTQATSNRALRSADSVLDKTRCFRWRLRRADELRRPYCCTAHERSFVERSGTAAWRCSGSERGKCSRSSSATTIRARAATTAARVGPVNSGSGPGRGGSLCSIALASLGDASVATRRVALGCALGSESLDVSAIEDAHTVPGTRRWEFATRFHQSNCRCGDAEDTGRFSSEAGDAFHAPHTA